MILEKFFHNLIHHGLESVGKYYSNYRGYVSDNEDPDDMNRIKVIVPVVTRSKTHPTWAWPKNTFSGSGYGVNMLPMVGDMVMVEFDHGDPKFPIWSHAHYAEGEKPEEFVSHQVYGFKSPKGQLIIIDDRDDVEKIIINKGENAGLVQVIELTAHLNLIEDKINKFLEHYRVHQVVDPISGIAGPLLPQPPAPSNIDETLQEDIENENIQH